MQIEGYVLNPRSKYTHSLDSFVFSYQTVSGSNDILKIEINYSNRMHVKDIISSDIVSSLQKNININRLANDELIASKLNALVMRTTPRDVYDIYNLFAIYEKTDLIKKIAIFYMALSADIPFNLEQELNRCINTIELLNYNKLRETLIPVLHKNEKLDIEKMKETVINHLKQLFILNDSEKEFVNKFNSGVFEQKLLFENYEINDMQNHPMIKWKISKS